MLKENALIINGKSTSDLPFYVAVEEVPSMNITTKKDKIYDLPHVNGMLVSSINAWSAVVEEFTFYLYEATPSDLRAFKAFVGTQGTYSRYNDPNIHRKFIATEITSHPIDLVGGYAIVVSFTCDPFEYEEEQVITLQDGARLINHTTAPMYPRLEFSITSIKDSFIEIGKQKMTFEVMSENVVMECMHGYQDVYEKYGGKKLNGSTRGEFFEIQTGDNLVRLGRGISQIRMTTRWGWI